VSAAGNGVGEDVTTIVTAKGIRLELGRLEPCPLSSRKFLLSGISSPVVRYRRAPWQRSHQQ
jgi:hypothetical protein